LDRQARQAQTEAQDLQDRKVTLALLDRKVFRAFKVNKGFKEMLDQLALMGLQVA
jgi:hypothetical protein